MQIQLFASLVLKKLSKFLFCPEASFHDVVSYDLQVELDGEEIELTDIEGIVILNIASWGGGCRPWELAENKDDFKPARLVFLAPMSRRLWGSL